MANPTPPRKPSSIALQPIKDLEIVFIVGTPGAKRRIRFAQLAHDLGILFYTTGDIFSDQQKDRTSRWKKYLELRDRICKDTRSGRKRILIDGFSKELARQPGLSVRAVILFERDMEASIQRSIQGKPPVQSEDLEKKLRRRYRQVVRNTAFRIRGFEDRGLLRRVDFDRSEQEVHAEVERLVKESFSM